MRLKSYKGNNYRKLKTTKSSVGNRTSSIKNKG